MEFILSSADMKESVKRALSSGISQNELISRAGTAVFGAVKWREPTAVICGNGDNAGCGYVIASLLHVSGIPCRVFRTENTCTPDGKYFYDKCKSEGVECLSCDENTDFSGYGTVVDCVLGSDFNGVPDERTSGIIRAVNASGAYVVSVGINSGLSAESGMAHGECVISDITVSPGFYRPGHFLNMAKDKIKNKISLDIGLKPVNPISLFGTEDARGIFGKRDNFSNKSTYGYIAIVGGSLRYSGAVRLASASCAAMRSGAGVVRIGAPRCICERIIPDILESTLFPLSDDGENIVFNESEALELIKGMKAVAVGIGMGRNRETAAYLEYLLKNYNGTLIIDADGLGSLAEMDGNLLKNASCKVILTPHTGEFSRLCRKTADEINDSPIRTAEKYASENNVTLLLKGASTIVTDGVHTYITDRGCPGMATAGSGDVLTGILAALCGQNPDNLPLRAVSASYINGAAGELAQNEYGAVSMTAGDTVHCISKIIKSIT